MKQPPLEGAIGRDHFRARRGGAKIVKGIDSKMYRGTIYLVLTLFGDGGNDVAEPIRRQKRAQPLNHSEFHILLALADGERHGYGIMQEVEARSAGTVRLGPGTLYGAIKRMLAAGLIEESAKRPISGHDDQRRRCYYRLTRRGRRIAAEEAQRLAALVRVAEAKRLVGSRAPSVAGGA